MEFKIGARMTEVGRPKRSPPEESDGECSKTNRTSKESSVSADDIIPIPLCWEDDFDRDEHPYRRNIDITDEENHDFTAMYITRYLNLGSGLKHSDPKWQNHLTEEHDKYAYPEYSRGSIRSAFENADGQSLDELTAEIERKLRNFKGLKNYYGVENIHPEDGIWKRSKSGNNWVLLSDEVRNSLTFQGMLDRNSDRRRITHVGRDNYRIRGTNPCRECIGIHGSTYFRSGNGD
jgi:hypothetical protein